MSKTGDKLFNVQGKVVLVTGGSRGLGLEMAEGLLEYGAKRVYITSRKEQACNEAVEYLNKKKFGGEAISLAADISKPGEIDRIVSVIGQWKDQERNIQGPLDILIANAGATWGAPLENHGEEAFARVMDLNVKSVFICIQKCLPFLEKCGTQKDPSRVIVTGSIAAIIHSMGAGTYGYLASKAAIHHLASSLALELAPRNITVNTIAPGFFPSKMSNGIIKALGKDTMEEANPRGRLGEPQDLVATVVFLCSPGGSYVNGIVLPIDGGQHLQSKF